MISDLQTTVEFFTIFFQEILYWQTEGSTFRKLLACIVQESLCLLPPEAKKQLTETNVEQTRRIVDLRIHVERVIGLRQKYRLLSAVQPIDVVISRTDSIPMLDKLVHVCCSLVNLCNSVVPFD